jgi:DNA invertase Pin-like site-specific DNA recombinase
MKEEDIETAKQMFRSGKSVMTAKQVCEKYGLTISQFRGIVRKVSKRKIEKAKKKKEGKSNGEEND